MMKKHLFYGSSTGNTEYVAHMIASTMGFRELPVTDIRDAHAEDLLSADGLILGVSTWTDGSLQYDWEEFLPNLDTMDLHGKKVALFGLGDSANFAGKFVNALRVLYDKVVERGAEVIGMWPTEGYSYSGSSAVVDNRFVGLAIDMENENEKTFQRVSSWCSLIKPQMT